MKTYYERLRDLREDRDFTQKDIAELLNTTQQVYSRYENGTNQLPIHHLITLSKFYKVSTDYILGLNDKLNNYQQLTPKRNFSSVFCFNKRIWPMCYLEFLIQKSRVAYLKSMFL